MFTLKFLRSFTDRLFEYLIGKDHLPVVRDLKRDNKEQKKSAIKQAFQQRLSQKGLDMGDLYIGSYESYNRIWCLRS